ncbi:hypothetical protein [Cedecea neteri]|uniref:gp53-like domain-containing protein n=1 Tax=Cedecea neteri TaxID=158822 RepID=UPI0039081B43
MALTLLAANNAQTVLAAGINSTATSLTVNTGTGALFPSPVAGASFFKLTLVDAATGTLTEIVHVTARSGDIMTIDRGQEGTTARIWSANDIAANMMTAGTISYILGNFQPLDATLTALAALATGANKLPYFTGTDAASQTDLTQVGRDIIGKSSLLDAQIYLAVDRLKQESARTYIASPDGIGALYVKNSDWGMSRSDGAGQIALPIASGGTGALTASAARTNLGLGSAATRDVGTGTNQLPGISSFTHSYDGGTRHTFDVPMSDGIFRTVTAQLNLPTGITDYTFPVAFPNSVVGVMVTQYSQTSAPTGNLSAQITGANTVRFVNWSGTGVTAQFLAIGR